MGDLTLEVLSFLTVTVVGFYIIWLRSVTHARDSKRALRYRATQRPDAPNQTVISDRGKTQVEGSNISTPEEMAELVDGWIAKSSRTRVVLPYSDSAPFKKVKLNLRGRTPYTRGRVARAEPTPLLDLDILRDRTPSGPAKAFSGRIEIDSMPVGKLLISSGAHVYLELRNCWIGEIYIRSFGAEKTPNIDIVLRNCYVGQMVVQERSVRLLEARGCDFGRILASEKALEKGSLKMSTDCSMPQRIRKESSFDLQQLRNLRVSAHNRSDDLSERLVHSWELRLERSTDPLSLRLMSWLYDACSCYGLSVSRAIATLLLMILISGTLAAHADVAALSRGCADNHDWVAASWFLNLCGSDDVSTFSRAVLWVLQAIVSPLSAFSDRAVLVSTSLGGVVAQMVISALGITQIAILVISIRRRFKV